MMMIRIMPKHISATSFKQHYAGLKGKVHFKKYINSKVICESFITIGAQGFEITTKTVCFFCYVLPKVATLCKFNRTFPIFSKLKSNSDEVISQDD